MILKIIMELYLLKSNIKKVGNFSEGKEKFLAFLIFTLYIESQYIINRRCKMFTKFKKYMKVIAYIIFTLIELFYIRIIFALYNAIQITRDGGFVKSIDENNSIFSIDIK